MTKSRVVLDTNVVISGVLSPTSTPGLLVRLFEERLILLWSKALDRELSEVLDRNKFDRYIPPAERVYRLNRIKSRGTFVEVASKIEVCRDPKDDHILALAVDGGADYIVTGDQDLLVLNPFRGIQIVSPSQFWDEMGGR